VVGGVSDPAAATMGLPKGTPVVAEDLILSFSYRYGDHKPSAGL
jgi:hypothetical protein